MKRLIYILSAIILSAGCNVLDFDESSSQYSREDMYTTYSNIQRMLTLRYSASPTATGRPFRPSTTSGACTTASAAPTNSWSPSRPWT